MQTMHLLVLRERRRRRWQLPSEGAVRPSSSSGGSSSGGGGGGGADAPQLGLSPQHAVWLAFAPPPPPPLGFTTKAYAQLKFMNEEDEFGFMERTLGQNWKETNGIVEVADWRNLRCTVCTHGGSLKELKAGNVLEHIRSKQHRNALWRRATQCPNRLVAQTPALAAETAHQVDYPAMLLRKAPPATARWHLID